MPTHPKPAKSQWRRETIPMRITDRDSDILEAIALNRVLDRDLLLWLFPPDPEATPDHVKTKNPEHAGTNLEKRLTKLFRNGYVDRTRTAYGGKFLYLISDRGSQLLKGDDGRAERLADTLTESRKGWQEKNRGLSTLFLQHTLAIARVRAALTVAGRQTGWTLTRFEAFGPDLPVSVIAGKKKTTLRPDALVTLTHSGRPAGKNSLHYFLEADRSSMHHDKMARKFRSYEAMRSMNLHAKHYDLDPFRVLIVTKSNARATELANLIAGDRCHFDEPNIMRKLFRITSDTNFLEHPDNIGADVWTPTDRPTERAAIVPEPLKRRT